MTQQGWLEAAYDMLRAKFEPLAKAPVARICSYGFPSSGGTRSNNRTIGQCWPIEKDGIPRIFVHPEQWTTPLDVLHVLVHEMIHAIEPQAGHRAPFKCIALRVGLDGKMTSTKPGPELAERLNALAKVLPNFPAAPINPQPKARKGSRLRLWQCPCGTKARVASDAFAAICKICDGEFERQGD